MTCSGARTSTRTAATPRPSSVRRREAMAAQSARSGDGCTSAPAEFAPGRADRWQKARQEGRTPPDQPDENPCSAGESTRAGRRTMPSAVPLRPLSARIVVALVAAIVILIVIGADSYRSAIAIAENARWVAHTHEVVSHLWNLSTDIVTVESRRRAYALTGDDQQVERAHASGASAQENLQSLRRLTADNPRQQERLDRLNRLVAARRADVDASIDRLRRSPADRSAQADFTAAASRANDEMRAVIREMLDEEATLLARRDADTDGSLRRTKQVIALGGVSAGVLVAAAAFLSFRESHHRQRAEAELRRREALYRSILSQFPNGAVLLFDRDLRYRLAEGQGLAEV